ncbi:FKBP-type peptidyl-prolyl cis-trans isomerase [Pseudoluteimonas lycopersici]|uniref:Peptidyl-prolyl cis-trans isomerase n=1 Tax=Pseudoluteimonas lycopersici TaxID=1324796 RepID=A0A516V2Q3_9GAMM|nr:FKBP-type peptidyl-prolyl cis-trans isomerase [Lysobacter lycopersici]QDQ72810.1 FKBP-type peptidyl-prolyl cis-trans isomerase [Lysobacter lycopersici]
MRPTLRGIVASALLFVLAQTGMAQDKTVLATDRDKVSYMAGIDVAHSIAAAAPDMDYAAFERALRNGFAGGKPLLGDAETQATGRALMQAIGARKGQPPGTLPAATPGLSSEKVGLLVGADAGRSLAPVSSEIDVPTFMQALRTVLQGGKPLLSDEEATAVRTAFTARMNAKQQALAAQAGSRNLVEGQAFLAKNKAVAGVHVTPSGLQYMVLRQGAGPQPMPTDRVRVNYRGTLLDGTEFDSSYKNGEPAEFGLDEVIRGWTEGVGMMPVGSKYRFWVPANLGYGAKGTPGGPIPPNATLVFDVELMAILPPGR